ncbi:MAG: ABC transporter permease [Actinomycetota bacterium]
MSSTTVTKSRFRRMPALHLVQRNLLVYRHTWMVIFSGFFEPLFYLLAVGYGVGSIIGKLPVGGGRMVEYAAFVAPAMLATSCVNGAITDGFFNPFFKLHYQGTYDGILATPMSVSDIAKGEVIWALIRGSLYSVGFLLILLPLGLIKSPWGIVALPAAIFVSACFSSAAILLMTFAKKIDDFDKVMNLLIHPMFLFSTTFFPLSVYPVPIRAVVFLLPLYHGIALLRGLTLGLIGWPLLGHFAYLAALAGISLKIATSRLEKKLIK